jgi:hypothetical protein
MPLIFLCYRRSDTGGVAGRLYDRLLTEYTDEEVFRDIDDIPGGANFVAASEKALAGAKVFIALVGKDWLDVKGRSGERRLAKPSDRVRVEVEMALRLEVPILPVLVDGAEMPGSDDLPDSMASFAFYNARHLDAHSFDHHSQRILQEVNRIVGRPVQEVGTKPPPDTESEPTPPAAGAPLNQLLLGMWQLQIQYPNGFVGQASAQFLPTGQFVVQGVAGQAFEIQGIWQVDPMGSLALNGQQTDGFNVLPYQAVFQFTSTSQNQLQAAANTGEQGSWTRVG